MLKPKIRLVDVYRTKGAEKILYDLMGERDATVNISHRKMPSWKDHVRFIRSRPYQSWHLISAGRPSAIVGAAYLSKNSEIGVFLFKAHRGNGYGEAAVRALMKKHPGTPRFLANINPNNLRSIEFFQDLGFRHIQNTYELFPSKK
jgi:RimJ/RimL family protein N-acetyltransferase